MKCRAQSLFLVLMLSLLFLVAGCGGMPKSYVVLLEDLDKNTGAVIITNPSETRVLYQANFAVGMDDKEKPPSKPFPMKAEKIQEVFGKALDATPEPPISFTLYFVFNRTKLLPSSKKQIPEIMSAILQRKTPNISTIGHADRSGEEQYNYGLALRRAKAVRNILAKAGLDPNAIEVTSHGENNPLVETADGVFEPRNRRVEVTVR
ncbi:MAG: OmpA family protein [Deltaproteobacteria bacterium]|nr:OmpA family protein [Deltaproteobacteria bacterium]